MVCFVVVGGRKDGGSLHRIRQWADDEGFLVFYAILDQDIFVAGVCDLYFASSKSLLAFVVGHDHIDVASVVDGLTRDANRVRDLSDREANLAKDPREQDLFVDDFGLFACAVSQGDADPKVDGSGS